MPLNRAALLAELTTNLPDNTSGEITPAMVRSQFTDIINNVWTLQDSNSFTGTLTYSSAPIFSGLSGILVGNGASAASALAAGQIPGTATNDTANAGNIGEYITATGTTIALTTATPLTITSISLTAGDWDVRGNLTFTPAASTTLSAIQGGTFTTTNVLPTAPAGGLHSLFATFLTGTPASIPIGVERYSLAGTTTIYLIAQATFATSTLTATGKIAARRVR